MPTLTKEDHDRIVRLLPKDWTAILFNLEELAEFRQVLDRAMNTWEPALQPSWLQEISDDVDRRLLKAAS